MVETDCTAVKFEAWVVNRMSIPRRKWSRRDERCNQSGRQLGDISPLSKQIKNLQEECWKERSSSRTRAEEGEEGVGKIVGGGMEGVEIILPCRKRKVVKT